MRRIIELLLAAIFIVSLMLMATANPDPWIRDWLCGTFGACLRSENAIFWNSLLYDLGLAAAASIVFYWLLVKWPDYLKRRRLRRHLEASYRSFRLEVTIQCMFAANKNRGVDYQLANEIAPMDSFRTHFKSDSSYVTGDKWDDVSNGISESIRGDLFVALTLLRDDVAYVLNNTDIDDNKSFDLLHGLQRSVSLTLLQPTESDDNRNLLSLLWQLMAGWDWIDGYPKEDRVQALIDRI